MATITPKIQKARAGLIRRLAETDPPGKVLSLYVDLDPAKFATPPARESQVKSLTNEAESMVEQFDRESKMPLREDVRLVREFLLGDFDWTSEARSVAIFASTGNGMFDVLKLPEPVERGVFIDDRPHVLPIQDLVEQETWCVLLVSRDVERIFIGSPITLKEYDESREDVRGQHDQGGWSQRRFANVVEEDVEDHLKKVAERILALHKATEFDHIVVAADEELWPRISERLHSYVSQITVGRIDADIQMATAEDLQTELKSIAARQEAEREQGLIGRLEEGLANDSRAAGGLERVLAAFNEARVETLLLAEDFSTPGVTCPTCGYLGVSEATCPVDRESTDRLDDIVPRLVERAGELAADTVTVRNPKALEDSRGIAALLRF
jgi:peptide chain release factor subunit 1